MRKFAAEKSKSLLAHRKLLAAALQHPTVSSISSQSSSHLHSSLPHSSVLLRFLSTTAANSSASFESMATDYSSTPVKIDSINPKVINLNLLVCFVVFVVLYWFLSFSSELVIWVLAWLVFGNDLFERVRFWDWLWYVFVGFDHCFWLLFLNVIDLEGVIVCFWRFCLVFWLLY